MMMRPTLLRLLAPAACALAALASCAFAAPWSQEELLQSDKRLRLTDGVIPCSVGGSQVIILFDGEGKAAAMVTDEVNKDVRRLARSIELGETREAGTGGCLVMLRESAVNETCSKLPDNSPLQAIAFLLESEGYTPTGLQSDGRVLWATGKRQSIDLLIPTTGSDSIGGAELKTDMELTEYAGNVLARKLGYKKSSDVEAIRITAARKLRADSVYYHDRELNAALATVGGRAFFFEGNRGTLQALKNKREPLNFPTISPDLKRTLPPEPQSEEPQPEKILTPKEARKAYIDRLRAL
ncbi:MAG: hypothetical protein MJ051_01560 [Akkermansia sp.]|nr:hypothetical protein [Akkermansia sp.]